MSNYKEVCTVPTDFGVTFTKFKSDKTGLTVMLADIEAPLVNGYFALATESFDDFGCPHTLEHLVFLGSEQYPYKGVLDSLANRAIAQGTNAWTDVDHTCYTITTAGSQGFLNLLPIYVDHILYPTLTDTGYHTEVHHINGKGEDAGVVYCEMQGCQNLGDDRLHLRMKRIIYPETCGYRSETGGLMERLRELSVEKIRDYHKSYYRPDNLCLIITGRVEKDELLKALEPVEESIIKKGPLPEMQRPWISTGDFPNLEKDITETVLFADEDESMGSVLIAWNGPMCHEYLAQKELEVLNVYLTDSPVSVLQKEFVEIEDALCTDVDFHITDHLKSTLMFTASSVPIEDIEEFPAEFFKTLRRIVEEKDIDMARMATVIEKETLKLLDSAETDAHETAAAVAISDFLYGSPDGKDLKESVKDHEFLKTLSTYSVEDWINVLEKWYINPPHITLFGKPSAEFAEQQTEDEENRIEKQREDLGEEKLDQLEKKLKDAMEKNDMPIPTELLEGFKIPSVSTIKFMNVITARNNDKDLANEVQEHVNKDDSADIPLFIQYDHVKSRFIKLSTWISASSIPSKLLPYTRLFLKTIFSLPIEKNGELISYEEVVKGLGEDTIEYDATLGTPALGFRELVVFNIKVDGSNFEKAIQWLHDILWNTKFTAERLKIVASQILNDIPQAKRDAFEMGSSTLRALQLDPKKSIQAARSILYQNDFLNEVIKRLEEDPSSVLAELDEFRSSLCSPENLRIHVTGDILKLEKPRTVFQEFSPSKAVKELAPVTLAREVLSPAGLEPGHSLVVTLPTIENSCSFHSTKGVTDYADPDVAPILVMIEILDTMEGVLWKLIRGQGLAYSCYLESNLETGLINFTIWQSPNAFKAFERARYVVEELVEQRMSLTPSSIEGAKSGVIYSLVARENTMDSAALQSFINQVLKKMPKSYVRDLLVAIQAVTLEDLQRVLNKYFVNLFKADKSNVVVMSAPTKTAEILSGFEGCGFNIKSITLNDITVDGIKEINN